MPSPAAQVDQVLIPATTGEFGVLPGHVPTVAQLKPGVLAVHVEADKNVKKVRPPAGRAGCRGCAPRPPCGRAQRVVQGVTAAVCLALR